MDQYIYRAWLLNIESKYFLNLIFLEFCLLDVLFLCVDCTLWQPYKRQRSRWVFSVPDGSVGRAAPQLYRADRGVPEAHEGAWVSGAETGGVAQREGASLVTHLHLLHPPRLPEPAGHPQALLQQRRRQGQPYLPPAWSYRVLKTSLGRRFSITFLCSTLFLTHL